MDFFYNYIEPLLKILGSTKMLMGIFVFCSILLILPYAPLVQLGVLDIVNRFRPILGITVLITFIFLIIDLGAFLFKLYQTNCYQNEINNRLYSLSQGELEILSDCIKRNSQSFTGSINSSSAQALCHKNLVTMADMGHMLSMSFTIRDFVWKYLKQNNNTIFKK